MNALVWLLKTIFHQGKYFILLSWWEKRETIKFIGIMLLLLFGVGRRKKIIVNKLFDLWDLLTFSKALKKILFFHPKMTRVLLDPKHKGIKAWEYGLFLSSIPTQKGQTVLDVGSGGSAFPFYLAQSGMKVTAFDLVTPGEKPNDHLLKKYPNLIYDRGNMLLLPYSPNTFDLVLSLSAIEHLDDPSYKNKVTYADFLEKTKKAFHEMIRVLKPNGLLYLTTDIYFPNLQHTDRYSPYVDRIHTAYKKSDFIKVFIESITQNKCIIKGATDFSFNDVLKNINKSIYRGRYFTTFAFYVQKKT